MARTAQPENFRNTSKLIEAKSVFKPVTLALPPAHPKQFELINALEITGRRFIVGACGTKFGKTYGSTIAIVQKAWNVPDSLNWWVSPTYAQSKMAYGLIKRLLPPETYNEYKADLFLEILRPNGAVHSKIEFKSGDNPDSLRGFGVNFFIMDEAARCQYESFVSLWTTVTQTFGRGFFISTPHARNWFHDMYQRGEKYASDGSPLYLRPEDDPWPEWYSIRMPTWANPHVSRQSIRDMKKNLPDDVFRQEVAAQFLADSAGVFRGIKSCIKGILEEPQQGARYVMGVDLARLKDYSVLTVMDVNRRHVVYHERFNKIAWEVQYQRIIEVARRYHAIVVMDSTGIGDPIVQTIQSAGIHVIPYQISGSKAKQQLIDKLRVNIENERVSFPGIPILVKELEVYEYEVSDTTGAVKYSAPSGYHDDCVISLALANLEADKAPFVYRFSNQRGI
jgi:hypothetical protein